MEEILIHALNYTGIQEQLDISEAAQTWEEMNRVLRQAGFDQRNFTTVYGSEYGYAIKHKSNGEKTRMVYASTVEYSSADCLKEVGIAHPFSHSASAVLRDNK